MNAGPLGSAFDWVGMSQSGKYFVVNFESDGTGPTQGTKAYDVNLQNLHTVSPRSSHGDICVDSDGDDCYVSVYYASSYKLDGSQVSGRVNAPGAGWGGHLSCRNINRPGWAYLKDGSSNADGSSSTYAAFKELVAVKLDGSGTVERFAKHFNEKATATYPDQQFGPAAPNRDGTKWFFNSNLGLASILTAPYAPSFVVEAYPASGDTTAPTVSITAPSAGATVAGSAVAVSATASDNVGVVGVQFKLDGANLGAEDASSPYSISWNTLGASNGAHTLSALARDAAGNTKTASVAVTVSNDVTAPTISAVSAGSLASASAVIGWTTNEASDSQVEYGPTTSYGQQSTLAASMVTSHSASLSGLSASTLYHYRVKSKDAAGNLATSGDFSFTTLAAADATAPTVAIVSPANGATVSGSITVSGTASDNVSVANVALSVDGGAYAAASGTANWTFSLNTTALANASHSLTVRATDPSGNIKTSAVSVTVSNDVTAPVISAVSAGSLASASAVIGWTTNEASDSQVEYGPTTSYGQQSTLAASMVTSHSASLSGLSASTLYHYRVKSKDAAGNLAASGDFSFTTLAAVVPIAVSVSPASVSVKTTYTQQFTATVTGTSNTGVSWLVNGAAGGNSVVGLISSGGLYTAPKSVPVPDTVTVTAKSLADASKSGSASVLILAKNNKIKVSVVLSPTSTSVLAVAAPVAAPATAILTVTSEDPVFPDAASISAQVAMPSGVRP
ncbi:MAG: Ig-like domain-containing protein [Elusimicrobiota bacterium]